MVNNHLSGGKHVRNYSVCIRYGNATTNNLINNDIWKINKLETTTLEHKGFQSPTVRYLPKGWTFLFWGREGGGEGGCDNAKKNFLHSFCRRNKNRAEKNCPTPPPPEKYNGPSLRQPLTQRFPSLLLHFMQNVVTSPKGVHSVASRKFASRRVTGNRR